jgi:hypothetical protein
MSKVTHLAAGQLNRSGDQLSVELVGGSAAATVRNIVISDQD